MWWDRGGIEKLALLGFDPGPCGSHVGHVLEHCSKIKNSENIQPILLICLLVSLWLRIYFFCNLKNTWTTSPQPHVGKPRIPNPKFGLDPGPWTSQPPYNSHLQLVPPVCPSIWTFLLQANPPCNNYLQSVPPACTSIWAFLVQANPHAPTISSWSFQSAHPYGHSACKATPMQQLSPVGPPPVCLLTFMP